VAWDTQTKNPGSVEENHGGNEKIDAQGSVATYSRSGRTGHSRLNQAMLQ